MKTTLNLTIVSLLLAVSNLSAETHYVSLGNTSPTPPYTNWVTAATNIQDAVSVASAGDTIIVTNGVYPGTVNVTNPLAVVSVNGPQFTVINGGATLRCAYLTEGASMTGFTLTKGHGGAYCSSTNVFLTNCIITGNSAVGHWVVGWDGIPHYILDYGGGVYGGKLYNCTLAGNSAAQGGGAYVSILYNCTLSGNQGVYGGGGAYISTLNNCIVYFNSNIATNHANYAGGTLNYCCTTPLPTNGVGNITNEPLFVETNGWSNLRLQSNSPCINAGNNTYVTNNTDLDGNPRIAGGTVDIGAYEFQPGVSGGRFDALVYSPAGFTWTFSDATVGQPYRIQTSTMLDAGSWSDLTNFTYTGPIIITDPSAVAGRKKFYRVVSP